jgi:hypothetical protein
MPAKNSSKREKSQNYLPKVLIGLMMVVVGALFSLTTIGIIIGGPVFVAGLVLLGFFYIKMRRESRK